MIDSKDKPYCKKDIVDFFTKTQKLSDHVKRVTEDYLNKLGVPIVGTLHDFDFDLDDMNYTIHHTFEYKGQTKTNFYVIPMHKLWRTNYSL